MGGKRKGEGSVLGGLGNGVSQVSCRI